MKDVKEKNASGRSNRAQTQVGIRTQQDRSAETHDKLIKAAITVLGKRGYANFTTSAVAATAKVSRGALQYHFHTRDDILVAARDHVAREMDLVWTPEELLSHPVEARLRMIIGHYWKMIGSNAYIAALEVRLYERFDRAMHKTLLARMNEMTAQRNHDWALAFVDTGLPEDELMALRLYMLDTLRGITLRRIEQGPKVDVTRQIELLTEMLIGRMQLKNNQA